MDKTIRIVDTTLRDGQMSLWATNLPTTDMLPVAGAFDAAGFDAIEVVSNSFFKKCARDLQESIWQRLEYLRARIRHTPLRAIRSRYLGAFQITPYAMSSLWMERLAAHGVRQIRISDPSNTVSELARQVTAARAAGLEAIVNLIFSVSPKHTDAYYAERARAISQLPAARLCLKDPGGLLTPERTGALLARLVEAAGGRTVEIHGHCTNGLGDLNALQAVAAGALIVNTAIAPLSEGSSLPDVEWTVPRLRALGYTVDVNDAVFPKIHAHLEQVRKREGWPAGGLAAADANQLVHQIPGGMISNFRFQLGKVGMAERLPEVLEEVARVREDLGYPIMVTPYSQFVGTQAAINVMVGERYREVTDEVMRYALGQWGEEEARGIAPNVKDRILDRQRAKELANMPPDLDLSVAEVRQRLQAGTGLPDDELLLRYMAGAESVARIRAIAAVDDSATLRLIKEMLAVPWQAIAVQRGDVRFQMVRSR